MRLTCVLFCLENNSYISQSFFDERMEWIGRVEFDRDYKDALHFANRQEAIDFLGLFEKEIFENSGFRDFTPREYYKLEDNE
jgi:hypothetical protein